MGITSLTALLEGVGIAIEGLRINKVRAILTISGVAVGVFVVVAVTSVVRGINESFAETLESAGPTTFYVFRRQINSVRSCDGSNETCPDRRNPAITLEEAENLERLPGIQAVTAQVSSVGMFTAGDRSVLAGLDLYTPAWIDVDGGDIYPGRSFTYAENEQAARVVILYEKLADALFDDRDPLDRIVNVMNIPMRVIGVYRHSASPIGTPTSRNRGDMPRAIIPFETGRLRVGGAAQSTALIVKPRPGVSIDAATDEVITALRSKRGLKPGQENNFAIVTQDRVMEVYNQLFGTFFLVMIALASVGLLVGGVGVIGIMLISVSERTREIGVRKALGATRGTILWQFLVEAITLTGVGAMLGLALGFATAIAIRNLFPIPASTPASAVVAALITSAITGVVFGMLPATRAARLDPVAALRHE
jgi:putative ABC transport system permease protein